MTNETSYKLFSRVNYKFNLPVNIIKSSFHAINESEKKAGSKITRFENTGIKM